MSNGKVVKLAEFYAGVEPGIQLSEDSSTLKALGKEFLLLLKDAERIQWLSVAGRWVEPQERDRFKSHAESRKAVHFYIDGYYTVLEGDTLRGAIDAAMNAAPAQSFPSSPSSSISK